MVDDHEQGGVHNSTILLDKSREVEEVLEVKVTFCWTKVTSSTRIRNSENTSLNYILHTQTEIFLITFVSATSSLLL